MSSEKTLRDETALAVLLVLIGPGGQFDPVVHTDKTKEAIRKAFQLADIFLGVRDGK